MLGSPIAHSLSPLLHRAAYSALGLEWEYDAHEVDAETLPGFVVGLDWSWRGLSLTMPLKEAALDLCDRVDPLARKVRAVNTVLLEPDGTRTGHNTDIGGLVAALREAGVGVVGSALVVGTGATARSAVAAVADLGCRRLMVAGRSAQRAAEIIELATAVDLPAEYVGWPAGVVSDHWPRVDVAVTTVPVAVQPLVAERVATAADVVVDVGYDPPSTPVLAAASAAGRQAVGGLAMLLHQAARQVELMTGCREAPLEQMRAAALAHQTPRIRRMGG